MDKQNAANTSAAPAGKGWIIRVIFVIIITAYFLRYAVLSIKHPGSMWNLIDWVNLVFHEAGHTLFAFFGEFIHVAMGSGFQVVVPVVCIGYFVWQRQFFSASFLGFWLGQNFINVGVYAGDAVVQVLPLLGGDDSQHDWNYLLNESGLINYTDQIAHFIFGLGVLAIIVSACFCLYFSFDEARRYTIRRHMGLRS